ncbi:MAG: glycoside hydrolase family 16 protein [Treponema sp.]|nr:glycoside hydrolase family 16 protein [Treponema sp.]
MKKIKQWAIMLTFCGFIVSCPDNNTVPSGPPPVAITINTILGVSVPVRGATPALAITDTMQYTGIIEWSAGGVAFTDTSFAASTVYTATITLIPKDGFTPQGVAENFFTVAGTITPATNAANTGIITAVFPITAGVTGNLATIDIKTILGVAPPVTGVNRVTAITPTTQYTGTVAWSPAVSGSYASLTVYTATITLTPRTGFTLEGVAENFFTVAGTTTPAANAANAGVITAVFPETDLALVSIRAISGVMLPVTEAIPAATVTETAQYTGTITWSPAVSGSPAIFAALTTYTATITITPKAAFTLNGMPANAFTVAGATATNAAGSGIVTAVFPQTDPYADGLKLGDNVPGKGRLVWRDEFGGNQLDLNKWNYDYGTGVQYGGMAGWGNSERQYYQPANVRVENGRLVIEVTQRPGSYPFGSGKITTKGTLSANGVTHYPAKDFMGVTTGYVEARIKTPKGTGFWPAFWLLSADIDAHSGYPAKGWPMCGEIDIMETNGSSSAGQTVHYGIPTPVGQEEFWNQYRWYRYVNTTPSPGAGDGYHVYAVRWDKNPTGLFNESTAGLGVHFYVNGQLRQFANTNERTRTPLYNDFPYREQTAPTFYNDIPWVLIFNLAVGGNYLGSSGGADGPPSHIFLDESSAAREARSLMVDWVRVYE